MPEPLSNPLYGAIDASESEFFRGMKIKGPMAYSNCSFFLQQLGVPEATLSVCLAPDGECEGVAPRTKMSGSAPVKARNPKASVAELVDAGDSHSPGMLQQSLHAVRVRLPPGAPAHRNAAETGQANPASQALVEGTMPPTGAAVNSIESSGRIGPERAPGARASRPRTARSAVPLTPRRFRQRMPHTPVAPTLKPPAPPSPGFRTSNAIVPPTTR